MTTANCLDTTDDGYIYGYGAWATAHETAYANNTGGTSINVGMNYAGGNYTIMRGFVKFDTSSIPVGATIDQVNMRLTPVADYSTTDFDVQICKCDWSGSDPISSGNMDSAFDANLAASTDQVWRNTSGWSVGTSYDSPNLDTSWINKGGYTYYGIRSAEDYSSSAPSGAEYAALGAQDNGTEAFRPLLIVQYTEGGVKKKVAIFMD